MKRTKRMKERIRSIVLAFAMVISLFAGSVDEVYASNEAIYEPLILNSATLNASTVWGLDDTEHVMDKDGGFYSSAKSSSNALPDDGKMVTSDGVPYQLAWTGDSPYAGKDSIRFEGTRSGSNVISDSVTMKISTFGIYDKICVLGTAGGFSDNDQALNFRVTLTYTDGTKSTTTYSLYDWYKDADVVVGNGIGYKVFGRLNKDGETIDRDYGNNGGPMMQSKPIECDEEKILKDITFEIADTPSSVANEHGIYAAIYAVTGMLKSGAPARTVASVQNERNDSFTLSWEAVDGANSYAVDVSNYPTFQDASGEPSFVSGYMNKTQTGTSAVIEGLTVDTTYYCRVRAIGADGAQGRSSEVVAATTKVVTSEDPEATDSIDYAFDYAYDCQRSPEYPKKSDTVSLHGFTTPLGASETNGNWELIDCGKYDSSKHVETQKDSLANIVSSVAGKYGTSNSEIKVYDLKKDGVHICYGVVCTIFDDGALFIGTTWSGGGGYYLCNTALSSSDSFSEEAIGDTNNPVTVKPGAPSEDIFIETVHVEVDWSKVPSLVKGSTELPEIEEMPATITAEGSYGTDALWGVKLDDSFKITLEDDYYNEVVEIAGESAITSYNEMIEYFKSVYGWAPLDDVLSNPYYTINENDIYVMFIGLEAESGYTFGGSIGDEYTGEVTSNVTVGCKIIDGDGGSILAIGLELGTLAEMEQEKNPTVHTHSLTEVPAKAATCTTDGNNKYYKCDCGKFYKADGTTETTVVAETIGLLGHDMTDATCTEEATCKRSGCDRTEDALGHDWTGEWTIIKEATAIEDGKKETLCTRGCGQKKVAIIPATGTTDDNANLEKDAEVEPEAPIDEATLNNSKEELLGAGNIFEDAEKAQIENGTDARVWLEVTKTDESAIASTDKAKIEQEATQIMGDNLVITYFDADLFKQVGTNERTPVPEPGIAIKITITIPDELLNSDGTISREYQIIRLHEGQVDVISGTFDSATGEFTFESDKFSTYAIVYKDVPVNDNPNPTPAPGGENPTPVPGGENPTPAPGGENPTPAPGGGENPTPAPSNNDVVNSGENKLDEVPKTGESNVTLYFFILMLLSGAGVVICSRIKKNSNKES